MDAYDFLLDAQLNDDIHIDIWTGHYCDTKYNIIVGNVAVAKNLELGEADRFLEDWENFEHGTFVVFPTKFARKFERYVLKEKYRGMDPLPFVKAIYKSASEVPEWVVEELPDLFKYVVKLVSYQSSVRVFADEA